MLRFLGIRTIGLPHNQVVEAQVAEAQSQTTWFARSCLVALGARTFIDIIGLIQDLVNN